jgi:hypothetical protein
LFIKIVFFFFDLIILDGSYLAYVENSDIRNLDSMKDKTILAVRATHGTHLEVPNPDLVCVLVS